MRAWLLVVLEVAPGLEFACAHICLATLEELPRDVVVYLEPLALDNRLVYSHAEPFEVLWNGVVPVRVYPGRVGVLEPVVTDSAVPLDVFIVEYGHSAMADMKWAGWVRGHPHPDLPGHTFQVRQPHL